METVTQPKKSPYFKSLDYYSRREAKVTLSKALHDAGWTLFGYHEDQSDSMSDWDGIATKDGYVIVVDVSSTSNSGLAITKTTPIYEPCERCLESGEEPGGWTLENARKDPKGWHEHHSKVIGGRLLFESQGAISPLFFTSEGFEKCHTCKGNGKVLARQDSQTIGHWPTFQVNPKSKGWHVEKDGTIINSGQSIAKMSNSYWEGHSQQQHDAAMLAAEQFIDDLIPSGKPVERQPEPVQVTGSFEIVDYSEKALAVFGDTKPIKDRLKDAGGRFNGHLTHPSTGQKMAGWIFSKKQREKVQQLITAQ